MGQERGICGVVWCRDRGRRVRVGKKRNGKAEGEVWQG